MEFLEFTLKSDKDDNQVYVFYPIGPTAKHQFGTHKTKITLNELGEDLEGYFPLVKTKCSCKSFKINKKDCKHIKEAIKILNKRGVKVRYELPTEDKSKPIT